MKPTAQRMEALSTHFFATLGVQIARMLAGGVDVIRLDEGAPDLPPPAHIVQALAQAASNSGAHSYQPHRGIPALREAWAEMYARVYKVSLDPEREILPLLGSKEGIFHLSLAILEPGDAALVPDPGYVTYSMGARFAGAEAIPVPLRPENHFLPDLEAIPVQALRRAKLLWLNYPNNPTAAMATPQFFSEAVEFAARHGLLLCHDAAYTQVTFTGENAPSLLSVPGALETAVEFNSLSKSHNMAGWRVGAVVGNPEALSALFRLKTNADSGHFRPVMEASVAAMTGDQGWLLERNTEYRLRRDVLVDGLRRANLVPCIPEASIYVWCPAPNGLTGAQFAEFALERAQVSLTPGIIFGREGAGWVRISLTAPLERIVAAVERIERMLLEN